MTNCVGGGPDSRKIPRQPCRRTAPRSGRVGADLADRFHFAKRQQSRENFRSTGLSVLGSSPSRSARTESQSRREPAATESRLLCKQRLLLGRRNPLCPAHAMEQQSALSLLEWSGGPRTPRPGKRLHENCRHSVGAAGGREEVLGVRQHSQPFAHRNAVQSSTCPLCNRPAFLDLR